MALRLDGIFTEIRPKSWITLATLIPATVLAFARLGLYRAIVRFMAEKSISMILLGAAISSAVMFATSQIFLLGVPRSVSGIYFSLLVLSVGGTRLVMRYLFLVSKNNERIPVVIYGAGEAGRLLMNSLQNSKNYRPCFFIDDDTRLHGSSLAGLPILSLKQAEKKISDTGVLTALIAIGDHDLKGQRTAAAVMAGFGLEVRMMPRISDLVSGRIKISTLRQVKIDELLSREEISPNPMLMSHTTRGRSVMVTGAGGSIGQELCRQVVGQSPSRIIVFDVSEYALFTITEELNSTIAAQRCDIELVPVLGSVVQQEVIERTIVENDVETIFHAAAYKHVPLVEANAAEAVRNNVLGTHLTAQVAGRLGVKHFTLISTDKAVRPTNIMGATKRLAELAVSQAATKYPSTKFCSVRFGNVLGSSGSVVPKFEKQIREGGPITLTHPDITRYFMTIQEASQLVIQASALAESTDVFLLDMGEPVRILDLARTMCTLHARHLHTNETERAPEGSIALEITGLRPGEKLYEELLLSGREVSTAHPKIKCEVTPIEEKIDFLKVINGLLLLKTNDKIAKALERLPLGYVMDKRYHS